LLWLVGLFPTSLAVLVFLQLAYVELGHTASAFINLIANWAGHIELYYGGAFRASSIHSARLSCRPYKCFSSSATHMPAKNSLPFYKLRCTNCIIFLLSCLSTCIILQMFDPVLLYHVIIENISCSFGQVISITSISCSAQLTSFLLVSSDCRLDSFPFLVA
jgi:hypothetical protein